MGPEDVSHEQRSSTDKLLLAHADELLATHGHAVHKVVHVRPVQTELLDGPVKPVTHVAACPVPRVAWYQQLPAVLVPGPIGGLERNIIVMGAMVSGDTSGSGLRSITDTGPHTGHPSLHPPLVVRCCRG